MENFKDLGKGIIAGILHITPEMAEKMLLNNTMNRRVKPGAVSQFAIDMREGQWQFNGEPIIFNNEKKLIDGQHRLMAVIEANMSFEFIVIRGVKPEMFTSIDTGFNRNAIDILSINTKDSTLSRLIAPLIQRIYMSAIGRTGEAWFKSGVSTFSTHKITKRKKLTNSQVLNYYLDNKEELDYCHNFCHPLATKSNKIINYALFLHAFYNLQKLNRMVVEEFFTALVHGDNLNYDSPIFKLRERLIEIKQDKTTKRPAWHYPAYFYKCWNAYRKGKPILRLIIQSSQIEPEKPI